MPLVPAVACPVVSRMGPCVASELCKSVIAVLLKLWKTIWSLVNPQRVIHFPHWPPTDLLLLDAGRWGSRWVSFRFFSDSTYSQKPRSNRVEWMGTVLLLATVFTDVVTDLSTLNESMRKTLIPSISVIR